MPQSANPLPPAGAPGTNLMSIDPQKNWRRYPAVPVTAAMLLPADVPVVAYSGGAPDVGAASGNNGETGTINTTGPAYAPKTQLEKSTAANLTPGTVIAPDVGKSYHGTRGAIEPDQPYPSTVVPVTVTPAQFLPSNYVPPVQGP